MKTKDQMLTCFHNAVADAISEHLDAGIITRQDLLEADLWTPDDIADLLEWIKTETDNNQ